MTTARPIQAALTSAATFAVGAAMPLAMVLLMPRSLLVAGVSIASLVFLALLCAVGARWRRNIGRATLRATFWGALQHQAPALIARLPASGSTGGAIAGFATRTASPASPAVAPGPLMH